MYRHVLAAVGLGPGGECAALHAFRLARLLGSRVTLLHVLESPETQATAELALNELRLRARLRPAVRLEPLQGSVAETILKTALDVGADLILLGARRRSHSSDGEPGSVAQAVAVNPRVAVQVVPFGVVEAGPVWPGVRHR